jgi:hypothetical protein
LYDRSRQVRYEPGRPRPTPEQLRQFEQQEFAAIAAHLRPFGISLAP